MKAANIQTLDHGRPPAGCPVVSLEFAVVLVQIERPGKVSHLLYYRSRYLDTELGRFISRDTIGVWADANSLGNAFSYVSNGPHHRTDATGECFFCFDWKVIECTAVFGLILAAIIGLIVASGGSFAGFLLLMGTTGSTGVESLILIFEALQTSAFAVGAIAGFAVAAIECLDSAGDIVDAMVGHITGAIADKLQDG